jgi:hypothetical protein
MTYLDDYQAQYKLEGVKLVKSMFKSVPPVLLTRSGVGELFYTVRTPSSSRSAHTDNTTYSL